MSVSDFNVIAKLGMKLVVIIAKLGVNSVVIGVALAFFMVLSSLVRLGKILI